MSIPVPNTTQLSVFDTFKGILQASSELNRINSSQYHQFEPNVKSRSFTGFPYIVITIPSTTTDLLVFNHQITLKEFPVIISLVVEFTAQDKVISYSNAIMYSIEAAETTLEAIGLYNLNVSSDAPSPEIKKDKEVLRVNFTVTGNGAVLR